MSGPLAIAATTAVLRELLQSGMTALQLGELLGGDVTVSVVAPDRIVREGSSAAAQLNLFLYNVVRNSGWANTALPSRDGAGGRVTNPPLGLDLYYLLTAYGVADYDAEVLLGGALQVLADTPGLGRDFIREALTPGPSRPNLPDQFQDAGLADQVESLKITPLPMPSDEISRLWSALQTPYRPSAACMLSVVLIEPRRQTRQALPVARVLTTALPLPELRVTRVLALAGPGAPIGPSSTLRIQGRNLGAVDLEVWIDSLDATAQVTSRANEEIQVNLAPLAADLRAGPAGVQLVRPVQLGSPPAAHEGFASNVATFVLVPELASVAVAAGGIDVSFSPPVGPAQRVLLLLNQRDALPGAVPRAYVFPAPVHNGIVDPATEAGTIHFEVPGIVAGHYLARLQVDGAQSALAIGGSGRYDLPQVAWP